MRLLPLATISALLAGCTVGPNYQRPAASVPSVYAEPGSGLSASDADLAEWWLGFGDTELDQLVNRAIAQNPDVLTAAARIREARARERAASAAALPEVDSEASASRQRISENAIPVPPGASGSGNFGSFGLPGSEFNSFRTGFDASWELDLFGKTRRSVEAARARTGAAIWNRRDAQVMAAAEVADTYFALRTLQQRIAAAEAEVARQRRFVHLEGARVRGGLVSGEGLAQQQSSLKTAQAAIPPLKAQADAQIHGLGVLTGEAPEALVAELSPTLALPCAPMVPAGLPSDLLRRRPDIRAAEQSLHAATADIGVVTADLYPKFSLTAAPALISTALVSLLEWGSRSYTASAALDWPIFNGGKTRATIETSKALQQQALIAYQKTILTALKDVEDALGNISGDRAQIAGLEQALTAAARAEQIASDRFNGGLVTYSDVLQAQASRISLESQLIEARGRHERDTIALFKALGGGWPELAEKKATEGTAQ